MWREANLRRGAILSPILGEGGLQPIVCCQPARSSTGGFSGCVARWLFWLCRQVVFWLCRQVCYWLCRQVVFWLCRQVVFWLCRQVVFLAVSPGLLLTVSSGGFLAGFARVCFPDVCQCVIAQDRASLNIEQVN